MMVKGITLSTAASLLIFGCGGGGGSGGGNNSNTLCINNSCIGYQAEYQAQAGLNSIQAASANLTSATGKNIRVSIVDTGIDSDHVEFSKGSILGTDFANSSRGNLTDNDGHGTHVAGIIAAQRNQIGMR